MEFLSNLWRQVSMIYGRLTASQRVTFLLLVYMILGSLVLLTALGARSEWVPVSAGGMPSEQLAKALADLSQAGITARESGGRLEVNSADRYRAVAALGQSGSLPTQGGAFDFNKLLSQSGGIGNIKTSSQVQFERQVALQTELERTLAEFRGVRGARVLLSDRSRPTFEFRKTQNRKASAILWLEPGESLSSHMVRSVANLVAYSAEKIEPSNVAVIDADRNVSRHVAVDDGMFSTGLLERKREVEDYLTRKLHRGLAFIPGLIGEVCVVLRHESEVERTHTVRPDESSFAGSEEEESEKTAPPAPTGTDSSSAGAMGSATVAPPAGSGAGERTRTRREVNTDNVSSTTSDKRIPAGEIEAITASIIVPLQYYRAMAARGMAEGEEPDKAAVLTLANKDSEKVRDDAWKLLGPKAKKEDVTVDVRYVPTEPVLAGVMPGAGGSGGVGRMLERYGTTGVLAGLAVTFMFLLSRWVKRPAGALAAAPAGAAALGAGGTAFTAPDEEEPILLPDGTRRSVEERRLDEMRKRIEEMAKQDPANAAGLVARWLGQG